MKRFILLFFLLLYKFPLSASDSLLVRVDAVSNINVAAAPIQQFYEFPINTDYIVSNLDSLVSNWYISKALSQRTAIEHEERGVELPDSVYSERLRNILAVVSLPYNTVIRNHIHVYTLQRRTHFGVILGLEDYYFPMIENIFESYGLPTELKYLAIIESALNPQATSRSGAAGLWQFITSTGRAYGLTINSILDERRDPIKSTHAAAKYLIDLFDIYRDWTLVIAAYNCGPGNVNKAISRSGNKKDFWEIYYRLPSETRGYIPQFVAAAYTSRYYADHNISPIAIDFSLSTDTVMVDKDIHLTQISEVLSIPREELTTLNPEYRTGLVPASSKAMPIMLPMDYVSEFITMEDSIRNYKADIYVNKQTNIGNPTQSSRVVVNEVSGKSKIVYTVKSGDNLGYIADWFDVGLSNVRYWNDIYTNTIRIGQKINVFVDPDKYDFYSRIDSMSFEEKQRASGR